MVAGSSETLVHIYTRLHGVKTQTIQKPTSIKATAVSFIDNISSASRIKGDRRTEVIENSSPDLRYLIVYGTNESEHH